MWRREFLAEPVEFDRAKTIGVLEVPPGSGAVVAGTARDLAQHIAGGARNGDPEVSAGAGKFEHGG